MANQAYNRLRDDLLAGNRDFDADDIRCVAVTSGYTYSAAHTSLADIPAGNRVAVLPSAIAGVTVSGGIVTAPSFSFLSVPAGSTIVAFIFYVHAAAEADAELISHQDTQSDGTTPISVATDGNNVTVTLGANGFVRMTNPTIP